MNTINMKHIGFFHRFWLEEMEYRTKCVGLLELLSRHAVGWKRLLITHISSSPGPGVLIPAYLKMTDSVQAMVKPCGSRSVGIQSLIRLICERGEPEAALESGVEDSLWWWPRVVIKDGLTLEETKDRFVSLEAKVISVTRDPIF